VRHRLGAERVAQREEHRSRTPQGRFDVGLLALGRPNQELIDVERLGVRLGVDPRLQFGWQLLHDVPGLPARQPLGQRLQRGLQGAVCRLATYAARRLRTTATISSYSIPALPECGQPAGRDWRVLYVPAALHLVHAYVAFDFGQGRDYQPDHGRENQAKRHDPQPLHDHLLRLMS